MMGPDEASARRGALAAGALAYLVWGLLPVYLKAVDHVPPPDVLAHRIIWSLVLCIGIALALRTLPEAFAVLRNGRRLAALVLSAVLIGGNWLVYIWAIANHHIVDASFGYFINPLINVLFGVVLLRERLDRAAWVAVALAVLGVAILTIERGALPWLSLGLALSFALYSLVRKQVPVQPVTGMLIETLVLLPFALIWVTTASRTPLLGNGLGTDLLLIGAGPVTAIPLMMFAYAARRLPLITIGLMQYAAPTMVFLLGAFAYHEPLSLPQLAAFGFIWAGVALYAADSVHQARRRALAQRDALR